MGGKAHHALPPAPSTRPSQGLAPFVNLTQLSISSVGLTSLDGFPSLPKLRMLTLSDNRITGGLQHLVTAGLQNLVHLDMSNNRFSTLAELAPLAQLRSLRSLDLFQCPITSLPAYKDQVFDLIDSLEYLDGTDREGNDK